MIKPNDILYVGGPWPLMGSKLNCAYREAVVSAFICACQEKNEWKKVRKELTLELEKTAIYCLHSEGCEKALLEMINERLFVKGENEGGYYLDITPKLLRLLITSTYSEGAIYSNAKKLLKKIPREPSISDTMETFGRRSIINPA